MNSTYNPFSSSQNPDPGFINRYSSNTGQNQSKKIKTAILLTIFLLVILVVAIFGANYFIKKDKATKRESFRSSLIKDKEQVFSFAKIIIESRPYGYENRQFLSDDFQKTLTDGMSSLNSVNQKLQKLDNALINPNAKDRINNLKNYLSQNLQRYQKLDQDFKNIKQAFDSKNTKILTPKNDQIFYNKAIESLNNWLTLNQSHSKDLANLNCSNNPSRCSIMESDKHRKDDAFFSDISLSLIILEDFQKEDIDHLSLFLENFNSLIYALGAN